MNLKIKKIELTDFKGVRNASYEFGDKTKISAENGAGKTTISDAFYWLFTDKNYSLASNPNIRPNDGRECTPTVVAELEIDGKPVTVAKMQKCTVKKSRTGGNDTVSLSNSYEVNSVEYGERDFKAKLNEYGFDFELFLALSHPDVFTIQKSNDMRKVLFSLASEKSDLEIAQSTDGVEELTKLLENYTMEEVKAMQNATLRKIKEDYGKEGEILRAKIEGLESAKVDIDVAEYELGKRAVTELIKSNKEKQDDVSKQYEEYQKLSDGVLELQFELNDLQRKANDENTRNRRGLDDKITDLKYEIDRCVRENETATREIKKAKQNIECYQMELETVRDLWRKTNDMQFDKDEEICQMCGQKLQQEKIDALVSEFDDRKAKTLSEITDRGNDLKNLVDSEKERIMKLESGFSELVKEKISKKDELLNLEDQLSKLPQSIDISDREDVKAIKKQIAEKEKAMQSSNSADEIRSQLKAELEELQEQYNEFERKIAKASNNVEIDEQILELRAKQGEYEQSKADCEKILYQLSLVSRKKNELLTEEINKHFKIVKWQLHDYQKNGSYIDVCIPFVDDRQFGTSTNKGREILAKLDIISGLQKFFGQSYPVFLDNAESLSEQTANRIDTDCQLIMMVVSEDKELRIESEE